MKTCIRYIITPKEPLDGQNMHACTARIILKSTYEAAVDHATQKSKEGEEMLIYRLEAITSPIEVPVKVTKIEDEVTT